MSQALQIYPDEWRARIELEFDSSTSSGAPRTRLSRVSHYGPLRVQRPFYPNKNEIECHVYLLHPPGGFVGNDVLEIQGTLEEQSHVLITTPAAAKFYRTREGCRQKQKVSWLLQNGASLAWLPQETIYFRGCNAYLDTRFELGSDSHLFYCDLAVFGRQASGEIFDQGRVHQDFTLLVDGTQKVRERLLLEADSLLQKRDWGLAGRSVSATGILCGPQFERLEEPVRAMMSVWNDQPLTRAGVTVKNGVMIVRYISNSMLQCKLNFESLGELLKEHSDVSWTRPRIWDT